MKRFRMISVLMLLALLAVGPAHAATSVIMAPPAGVNGATVFQSGLKGITASGTGFYTITDGGSVTALLRAGWILVTPSQCTWNVTLSSGVATTTVPCLAAFGHTMYQIGGHSTSTAFPTPTGVAGNVDCSITNLTTGLLECRSSSASDARTIYGFGY